MKKVLFPILVLVLALGLALPAAAHTEGEPQYNVLLAGQTIPVGNVTVWNDGTHLYVTYNITDADWVINATHMHVSDECVEGFPQTRTGNPKVGHFDYSTDHGPGMTTYTYTISLDGLLGTDLCIAAQAEVFNPTEIDPITGEPWEETAWGDGTRFVVRGNWAMHFEYTVQGPP